MNQTRRRFAGICRRRILIFALVPSACCTEPTFVMSFVKRVVALWRLRFRDTSPQLANAFVVKRIRRAHEDVIAAMRGIQTKRRRHPCEIADDVVGLFFRRPIIFLSSTFDVDAVLICAGEKESLDALLPFRSRNRVRHNHRVQVPEVRQTVGVVDGGGDVEGHLGIVNRESSVSIAPGVISADYADYTEKNQQRMARTWLSRLITDLRSYLRNLRITQRLLFFANSSFGLNFGNAGRFATRLPISSANSAS